MSSYLNIYLKPKVKEGEDPKEPMYLMTFSRCNEIYSFMIDELNITFIGTGENEKNYTDITNEDINIVINSIKESIKTAERNNESYLKLKEEKRQSIIDLFSKSISQSEDRDTMEELYEIFSDKLREISDDANFEEDDNEYLNDLEYALTVAKTLQLIIINLEYNPDFCGMCANFD